MTVGTVVPNDPETPLPEIAPGATMPIHLRIATGMGGGERISHLQVQARTAQGDDIPPAELVVVTSILVPLAVHPEVSSIIVHEEDLSGPLKQTVVLADLWPGEALPIKSITSSLGDKFHYRLVPTSGEIELGPRKLRKRFNLEWSLLLDATKPTFEHVVTITPDHPKAQPVEVRLAGKILPRCGLDTDSLAFCGIAPGERITRRIEYHYRDPSDGNVRVLKAPDWLSTSVSETRKGVKVFTLTCRMPEGNGTRAEQVCFEFGRDKKQVVLPVFVSCVGPANATKPP